MDFPCVKFGDFGISRFSFYRADTQNTEADNRHTDSRDYVGVSNVIRILVS